MSIREEFEAWADANGWRLPLPGRTCVIIEALRGAYQAGTSRQDAKIKELVEALEAGPSLMHTYPDKSACLCSHCEFIRLKNAAIAAAKETP